MFVSNVLDISATQGQGGERVDSHGAVHASPQELFGLPGLPGVGFRVFRPAGPGKEGISPSWCFPAETSELPNPQGLVGSEAVCVKHYSFMFLNAEC